MDLRDDDDELGESLSGQDYIDNPNKRLEQKEKREKKQLKKLKTQAQLHQLKMQQEQKNAQDTFGTKTLEQEIKEQVQQADTDPRPDTLIDEANRREVVDQQTQYEDEQQIT